MEIALARVPGLESEPVENKKAKGPGREKNWAAAGKGLEAGVGPDHMPVGTEVVVVVVVAAVVAELTVARSSASKDRHCSSPD